MQTTYAIQGHLRSPIWAPFIVFGYRLAIFITGYQTANPISVIWDFLSQAAQSRCTVVRPIQKSIGKWD